MLLGMVLKPVKSSNLQKVGYDPASQKLVVQFRNGAFYEYKNVPSETYDSMMRAPSVGKYFSEFVRNRFSFDRVTIPKPGERI